MDYENFEVFVIDDRSSDNTAEKLKEIEQTLGRISPISKEGKNAQLYVDAMVNYPEVKNYSRYGRK